MSPFYIKTYRQHVSRSLASRIDLEVKRISPVVEFVLHECAGNEIHAWIERPNDGQNDSNYRRAENNKIASVVDSMMSAKLRASVKVVR
jgi:hypothetical protein